MTRPAIRSILVAGDGIVGLSAALAFSRALPGVEVSLLGLPVDPAALADQFCATLPAVGRFHAAIGIDEIDLIRRGIAVHHLGTRFAGGPDGDWVRSFGEVGRGEGAVPFHAIWLGAKRGGTALQYSDYSPASVIGRAGKFVHPSGDPQSPLASYLYGLRVNPERYREALLVATEHLPRVVGTIAAIERRDDGAIAGLRLADGGAIEADLYLDCSGPAAALIGAMPDEFDDWSQWLPARYIDCTWEASDRVEPLDRVEQVASGWRLVASVPGARLSATVTSEPTPGSIEIRPGRRRDSFVANVLALGDGAVALDPLHGINLSLAHGAILRAIDLLPGRDCNPLELAEYNRLTALESDRARDYHALFQSQLPGVGAPPASLARTLTQWRARGRLPFFEGESFTDSEWAQTLIGLDIVPDAIAPLAQSIDPSAAARAMTHFAGELAALADRLPNYPAYLARIAGSPAAE